MSRLKQILIAVDQLANTFFGGWADETISSRVWRERERWPRAQKLVDKLFWFDPQHTYNSYLSERERSQLPPEFRNK